MLLAPFLLAAAIHTDTDTDRQIDTDTHRHTMCAKVTRQHQKVQKQFVFCSEVC